MRILIESLAGATERARKSQRQGGGQGPQPRETRGGATPGNTVIIKRAETHVPMLRGQRGHSQSQRENSHWASRDTFF